MAEDLDRSSDRGDASAGSGPPAITPAPRWVKVLGSLALLLLLVVVILHLTGNSLGGPGSHGMQHTGGDSVGRRP